MFETGWVALCWPDVPARPEVTVALLVRHFGFWSLNACRVVYAFEKSAPRPRFGFAYGTLTAHSESGEESFSVELDPADESVWYEIYVFSRPKGLAKLAYPLSRMLQRRFGRDSLAAMRRAVASGSC